MEPSNDRDTSTDSPPLSHQRCLTLAKSLYPTSTFTPTLTQGYCSYTLLLTGNLTDNQTTILQFRPLNHRIDLSIAHLAHTIHGPHAPVTTLVATTPSDKINIYTHSLIPGVPVLTLIQPNQTNTSPRFTPALLTSFAKHLSLALSCPLPPLPPRKIGSSLFQRLTRLSTTLPPRFRPVAVELLANLPDIVSLPWVLTHGDFVPGNIMLCPDSYQFTGLLDWGEAEYLPFGMGLYGLEELLGRSVSRDGDGGRYPPPGSEFVYYGDEGRLRGLFWEELGELVPRVKNDAGFRRRVEMAGELGVLLWHGFAFDEGLLDRVVDGERDLEEVQRLEVMLLGRRGLLT